MRLPQAKELQLFKKSIIEFARKELNEDIIENDEKGTFSFGSWKKCADMDLMALLCPKKYGGCEEGLLTALVAVEALSYACKDNGLVHAIATQLCCLTQIRLFGSEAQKSACLPELISGRHIAAQAMTEPAAGSDLFVLQTTAAKNGEHYVLNGSKIFISNAPVADIFLVFALTDPKRKKFGGISCFIVAKENEGLKIGVALNKMGLRTLQNGEMFLDDCRVPPDSLLGEPGQGMMIFNEVIEWERLILSAAHIGTMQRIMERCIEYAKSRSQFGQPIGKFQGISNKLADMKVGIEVGKSILYKAAYMKDQNNRIALEAAIAKLYISEQLKETCLQAVQLFGGYGYMKDFEIERDLRDSIAATIYSGTSEIQRNVITSLMGI